MKKTRALTSVYKMYSGCYECLGIQHISNIIFVQSNSNPKKLF